jgi:hypothetical protein
MAAGNPSGPAAGGVGRAQGARRPRARGPRTSPNCASSAPSPARSCASSAVILLHHQGMNSSGVMGSSKYAVILGEEEGGGAQAAGGRPGRSAAPSGPRRGAVRQALARGRGRPGRTAVGAHLREKLEAGRQPPKGLPPPPPPPGAAPGDLELASLAHTAPDAPLAAGAAAPAAPATASAALVVALPAGPPAALELAPAAESAGSAAAGGRGCAAAAMALRTASISSSVRCSDGPAAAAARARSSSEPPHAGLAADSSCSERNVSDSAPSTAMRPRASALRRASSASCAGEGAQAARRGRVPCKPWQ